jgi:hypothetical protein
VYSAYRTQPKYNILTSTQHYSTTGKVGTVTKTPGVLKETALLCVVNSDSLKLPVLLMEINPLYNF